MGGNDEAHYSKVKFTSPTESCLQKKANIQTLNSLEESGIGLINSVLNTIH